MSYRMFSIAVFAAIAIAVGFLFARIVAVSRVANESQCTGVLGPVSVLWTVYYKNKGAFLSKVVHADGEDDLPWHRYLGIPLGHDGDMLAAPECGHFAMVTGAGTVGDAGGKLTLNEVSDGWDNTLALVELPGNGDSGDWEFCIDDVEKHLDGEGRFPANSIHALGRGLMFMDGGIYRQVKPLSKEELKALATFAGGEPLTRAQLVASGVLKYRTLGTEDPRGGPITPDGIGERAQRK